MTFDQILDALRAALELNGRHPRSIVHLTGEQTATLLAEIDRLQTIEREVARLADLPSDMEPS